MDRTHTTTAAARQQPTVGARDALGLAAELFEQGLHEGTPPGLSAQSQAIDRRVCRAMRCPACRKRGMAYRPFSDGHTHYTVLAVCAGCGAAEEV
jgi:hypothetical protein